jgi:alpha-1,3-rhamnosyltransferase
MWLKISNKGYKISILNDVLAYYRKHDGNSHGNYKWLIDNVLKIYLDYECHPQYSYVVNQFLISMFVKTASREKKTALNLLIQISWYKSPQKLIKGIMRLILT